MKDNIFSKIPSTAVIAALESALKKIIRFDLLTREQQAAIQSELQKLDLTEDAYKDYIQIKYPRKANKIREIASIELEKKRKKQEVIDKETPTTPNYLTTSNYTLHSWGGFYPNLKLYIEQINTSTYIYNNDGQVGITNVLIEKGKYASDTKYYLDIRTKKNKQRFYFEQKPQLAPYSKPSLELAEKFTAGHYKTRTFKQILADVENAINLLYDFNNNSDLVMLKVAIGQSYLLPILESIFFIGVDATKGGGKTTILEILYMLMRHGYSGGEISPAAIPRLCNDMQCSIALDEIDQKIGMDSEKDVLSVLRKGQRRGNPYTRCEGRDNRPKQYEVFGSHLFSYRSELEDAFMSRTLPVHCSPSTDSRLPVLNLFKKQVLKPLADELFLWSVKNLLSLYDKYQERVVRSSGVVGCSGTLKDKAQVFSARQKFFTQLTSHFSKEEIGILQSVTGRNSEVAYIALDVAKLLDFDVVEEIKNVITTKQANETVSENYYLESLHDFLRSICDRQTSNNTVKHDGIHAGKPYARKNQVYEEFVQHLKEVNISPIGTKKYNSFLRDLGFVEGDTILNVRDGGMPRMCLVFSDVIQKRLYQLESPAIIEEVIA